MAKNVTTKKLLEEIEKTLKKVQHIFILALTIQ